MSEGLLLDSHTLLWLDASWQLRPQAEFEIARMRAMGKLFASHISVWELGVAFHKKSFERRPDLRGMPVGVWFDKTTARFGIKALRLSSRIAAEAAEVPGVYGSGDPGDCFLIATAYPEPFAGDAGCEDGVPFREGAGLSEGSGLLRNSAGVLKGGGFRPGDGD